MDAINQRFDNRKGLAAWLGKSPRYIDYLADQKLIPAIELPGRDRMFDRQKVLAALDRFEVKEVGRF